MFTAAEGIYKFLEVNCIEIKIFLKGKIAFHEVQFPSDIKVNLERQDNLEVLEVKIELPELR